MSTSHTALPCELAATGGAAEPTYLLIAVSALFIVGGAILLGRRKSALGIFAIIALAGIGISLAGPVTGAQAASSADCAPASAETETKTPGVTTDPGEVCVAKLLAAPGADQQLSFASYRFGYASAFSSTDGVIAGFSPEWLGTATELNAEISVAGTITETETLEGQVERPESAVVVQHLAWNPGLGSITERGIAFAPVPFESEEPAPFDQIAALFPGIYPGHPDFIWRTVADIRLDFTVNYTSCGEPQTLQFSAASGLGQGVS
ncbi:hypothetical protein QBL02_03905 [Leucobacter sp. UT-8R-CII-1-4]|uniref:hypothetical protein n=1 Tax=Leucobacter sp. UT-8R-CII-1-4 TaxID=3040075 RepID=UPI0024A9D201|nr:hypothetical protein [Leucobacter sp. UT-8R-CII-1-4]MDI6022684.1 hypothetical protein [Leucobacter sp. UT-8R-CII-1-4]